MMITITNDILFGFTEWVKTLQHAYAYMDVGGRATQEQLPSSPVYPPDYVRRGAGMHRLQSEGCKKLTKGVTISPLFHYASQANTTAWTQEVE